MPTQERISYLLLGEEDFLKEEIIQNLKSKFLNPQNLDLNYNVFYANDKDFSISQVLDVLCTMPFLAKKRVVVLKEAGSLNVAQGSSIISYLENPRPISIFIIESSSPYIKGEFLLRASKLAHTVYNRRLSGGELWMWVRKKVAKSGKSISMEAVRELALNLPNALRIISSELDNIILYTHKRSYITKDDVEKVIGVNPTHTAFDLIDSIAKKDARAALRVFSSLKRDKKKELHLLGLLGWNARMLLRVKELWGRKNRVELARLVGLNPRTFDELVKQASIFKKKEVFSLLDEILRADLDIKTGMPATIVVENLIVKACSS